MLISCRYYDKECNSSDFYYFHDHDYGNCFRFNGGLVNEAGKKNSSQSSPIKLAYKAGYENGLRLEMYTGNSELQQKFNYDNGVRVIVHNQSVQPFPSLDGIDVAPGLLTNIAISRTFTNRLQAPYTSQCLDSSNVDWNQNDVLKFLKASFVILDYNQKQCMIACLQMFIIKSCKCFYLKYPLKTDLNYTTCVSLAELDCVKNSTSYFYQNNQDTICFSKCPLQCSEIMYDLTTNQAVFPNIWYAKNLLNNSVFLDFIVNNSGPGEPMLPMPTLGSLRQTLLMINIYYDELFYTNIVEVPQMNFDLMIASIGLNFYLSL